MRCLHLPHYWLLLHSVMMVIYMGLVAGQGRRPRDSRAYLHQRRVLISHWPHQHQHRQTDNSSGSKLDHNILLFCLNKTQNKKVKISLSIKHNGDRHSITLSERGSLQPSFYQNKFRHEIMKWNHHIFKCTTFKLFLPRPTASSVYYCCYRWSNVVAGSIRSSTAVISIFSSRHWH